MKVSPDSTSRAWRKGTLPIRDALLDVFKEFPGVMSTRQAFYRLVSTTVVPNTHAQYERVQRVLVHMRECGELPFNRVVDRTRAKHQRAGWSGVEQLLKSAALSYRRNAWSDQSDAVMVAVEKQALEGVFAEEVDRYGASLWVCRGFPSVAFLYDWASDIRALSDDGKRVHLYYFGDHDPSGLDIERSIRDGLSKHGAKFEFTRRGLLFDDIASFNIPPLPVKHTDQRARAYIERHGDVGAELDALPPDELRRRIGACVEAHIDRERWRRMRQVEVEERRSLCRIAGRWPNFAAAMLEPDGGADPE